MTKVILPSFSTKGPMSSMKFKKPSCPNVHDSVKSYSIHLPLFRWLLRMIVKKGLGLLLCLLQASSLTILFAKLAEIIGRNRLQNSDQRQALV
jgi:hypothetical protein